MKAQPEIAFTYDQLGELALIAANDAEAEKWFHEALKIDPRLATSHYWIGSRLSQAESIQAVARRT